jgi:hypothetical protein
MPSAHTPAATTTSSLVNAKFSAQGFEGDFFLELLIHFVILRDVTATMGTASGQGGFEDFVDLVVWRSGPMAMLAIGFAAGTSGGLGLFLGIALGKRRGLPFVVTLALFELGREAAAFGLQRADLLFQFGNAKIALVAARAYACATHTFSVARTEFRSCASFITIALGAIPRVGAT